MTDFRYDEVAAGYDRFRRGHGPYLATLTDLAREVNAQTVVEIGCGTGNATRDFGAAHSCRTVGVDLSLEMLRKARRKGLGAHVMLVQGDAAALPIADSAAGFLFGVFVLQHIAALTDVLTEVRRVVRKSGAAAFATASHEFIRAHPMNAYFPSLAAVDTARFQDVQLLQAALRDAGFTTTGAVRCRRAPEPIDAAYVEKVAGQFISTYALLPAGEFEEGLARLRADVGARGPVGEHVWECVVVWARD